MSRVIVRRAAYDYETLKPVVFEIMDACGGGRIERGSRVLVKPNLLAPAAPDRAMLTHPLIVRAAVEYVLAKRARVQISDSPAMGSFERVLKESGIKEALAGLDVELKEFKTSVSIDVGEPFHRIEVAEDALNADLIVNLPKLKTHSQMLLTLGVKNFFGCIVGFRKPQWHLRAGIDREVFAMLLARICKVLQPSITVLDGILAMEGQGPGKGGVPKPLGLVLGSDNVLAVDETVCRFFGLSPDQVLTNQAARKIGMDCGTVEFDGDRVSVGDFKLPQITPLVFGPTWSQLLLRKHLVQRVVAEDELCKSCGECWRYCPAGAITHTRRRLHFDYDKCIRCYCCIEVCPQGALRTEEPLLGRLVARFFDRFQRSS